MNRFLAAMLAAILCVLQAGSGMAEAFGERNRISFDVRVSAEDGSSEPLSETVIEGPEGTDFRIDLTTDGFEMRSEFLTDPLGDSELLVRAKIETKRAFGLSPNGLPLFEIDRQEKELVVSFDESVVLLPFGLNGGGKTLRIEIDPRRQSAPTEADAKKLAISFNRILSSGEIAINARKIPHNYEVEAAVLKNGERLLAGNAKALFRQAAVVQLARVEGASPTQGLALGIEVEDLLRGRPSDQVSVSFELKSSGQRLITSGRGIGEVGSELRYPLDDSLGEGFELVFRIKEKK
ncbi:MAG TPA: hypothetical protein VMM38_03105 [Aridibacter sp.]|nr:hypothetical protein [Aridibacter sp.]